MPTPIGHTLLALSIFSFAWEKLIDRFGSFSFWPTQRGRDTIILLGLCLIFSNLPDLDFISFHNGSILVSGRFHHGISHSLGFALAASLLAFFVLRILKIEWYRAGGVIAFASYLLHIFFDLFNFDTYKENGLGLPFFWPISDRYYFFGLVPSVSRANPFTYDSLFALGLEILFFGLILLVVRWRLRIG